MLLWEELPPFGCVTVDLAAVFVPPGDCPRGDDPKTVDDVVEVQLLKCTASAGTFQLMFRQFPSISLSYDVTAADLAAALNLMDTINGVTVEYTIGSVGTEVLCDAAGLNVAIITFTQDFGDLPNLQLYVDSLSPASSVRYRTCLCLQRACTAAHSHGCAADVDWTSQRNGRVRYLHCGGRNQGKQLLLRPWHLRRDHWCLPVLHSIWEQRRLREPRFTA